MASYKVFIKRSAAKELEAVESKKDRRKLVAKIRSLGADPRPPGCQKLSGSEKYRVRQGVYRILYSIKDDRLVVTVVQVNLSNHVDVIGSGAEVGHGDSPFASCRDWQLSRPAGELAHGAKQAPHKHREEHRLELSPARRRVRCPDPKGVKGT